MDGRSGDRLPRRNTETICAPAAMLFGWPHLGWIWNWKPYGLLHVHQETKENMGPLKNAEGH